MSYRGKRFAGDIGKIFRGFVDLLGYRVREEQVGTESEFRKQAIATMPRGRYVIRISSRKGQREVIYSLHPVEKPWTTLVRSENLADIVRTIRKSPT